MRIVSAGHGYILATGGVASDVFVEVDNMKTEKLKFIMLSVFFSILIVSPVFATGEYNEISATKLPDFHDFHTSIIKVYTGDNFAFLKSYHEVYILDISNPERPKFFGNISDYIPQIKSSDGCVVSVYHNNLYISIYNTVGVGNAVHIANSTLYGFELSKNSISPQGSFSGSFGLIATNGKIVCALSSDYQTKNLSIELIDFTDSKNPKKVSEIPASIEDNYTFQSSMYSFENDLYLDYSDGNSTKIIRWNISNPKNPIKVSSYILEGNAASPFGSLSVSENYVIFISTAGSSFYLSIFSRNLEKLASTELNYLPMSTTSSGDYVFLQQLNSIEVFRMDVNSIENQTAISVTGTVGSPDAKDNTLYFVSQDSDESTFYIINFKEEQYNATSTPSVTENLLIVLVILIVLVMSIVSIIIWHKKKAVKPKYE